MKPDPTRASRMALSVACSVAVLLALAACGKQDDGKTVGKSIDSGIANTERAAKETRDSAAAVKLGDKVDDAAITATVSSGLAKDPDLSAIKINVDTKAGVVTLNGPAPTAVAKEKATEIAKQTKGVTSVNNQLVVKAN